MPVEIRSPSVDIPNWDAELPVFEFFLNSEVKNYGKSYLESIKGIFKQAREEHDYDMERFLTFYIQHQVESINEWEAHVDKIKSFTALPGLIWHLDAILK